MALASSPFRAAWGTDKEIFNGQYRANERDVSIYAHLSGFHELTARFTLMPIMSDREGIVYCKVARQA
ncbi:MAG: hypothetical protein WAL41_24900, partial [Mycobacterium sp.]